MDNGQHTNGTSLQGAPVAVRQRYIILDALRGFALLGIVLANFPEFSLWTFLSDEAQAALPRSTEGATGCSICWSMASSTRCSRSCSAWAFRSSLPMPRGVVPMASASSIAA